MKYVKKNRKEDEKKVMSTRVRSIVFDAFQNASEAAKDHGYSISLSNVVETALKETITELADEIGINYLDEEYKELTKNWEDEYEKELEDLNLRQTEYSKEYLELSVEEAMEFIKDSGQYSDDAVKDLREGVTEYLTIVGRNTDKHMLEIHKQIWKKSQGLITEVDHIDLEKIATLVDEQMSDKAIEAQRILQSFPAK
jgi:energy-converting hydrogenase A subunit M